MECCSAEAAGSQTVWGKIVNSWWVQSILTWIIETRFFIFYIFGNASGLTKDFLPPSSTTTVVAGTLTVRSCVATPCSAAAVQILQQGIGFVPGRYASCFNIVVGSDSWFLTVVWLSLWHWFFECHSNKISFFLSLSSLHLSVSPFSFSLPFSPIGFPLVPTVILAIARKYYFDDQWVASYSLLLVPS